MIFTQSVKVEFGTSGRKWSCSSSKVDGQRGRQITKILNQTEIIEMIIHFGLYIVDKLLNSGLSPQF